jgi:heat-inducible transcriptional repressor
VKGWLAPPLAPDQPQKVIANAAQLLSSLSQFVGVVMAPQRSSVFRHIEFLRLSSGGFWSSSFRLTAMCRTGSSSPMPTTRSPQLIEAANFLNAHYAGMEIEQVRERLKNRGGVPERRNCVADAGGRQRSSSEARRKRRTKS